MDRFVLEGLPPIDPYRFQSLDFAFDRLEAKVHGTGLILDVPRLWTLLVKSRQPFQHELAHFSVGSRPGADLSICKASEAAAEGVQCARRHLLHGPGIHLISKSCCRLSAWILQP